MHNHPQYTVLGCQVFRPFSYPPVAGPRNMPADEHAVILLATMKDDGSAQRVADELNMLLEEVACVRLVEYESKTSKPNKKDFSVRALKKARDKVDSRVEIIRYLPCVM